MTGTELPALTTEIPGPRSRAAVDVLARHECPAVTARRARRATLLGVAEHDPIVWDDARGANVRDVDGNRFVDLTSGFGVALVGHAHPAVVHAARAQVGHLPHAMGDVFPDAARIELLRGLADLAPPGLTVALLGLSGSDAIDAALKTAVLDTGRSGVLVFGRSYHGLALGVLGLQGYKESFGAPFRALTHPVVRRLAWAAPIGEVRAALADGSVGLVLVEPILGRGGVHEAPPGWLAEVAGATRAAGARLALDEVLTGVGRTGTVFACEAEGVTPDLLCVGKALGGGFPLSACLGTEEVMAAWGASTGEALHTQTFLGHPVGCAAGSAVIGLVREGLAARVSERGARLAGALRAAGLGVRGRGLMLAVGVGSGRSLAVSRALLEQGWLALPADDDGLQLTPPVTLSDAQIDGFVAALTGVA
ncbi:MAG: aspartate aminotransferase family protein [Myxococcota bacterium]